MDTDEPGWFAKIDGLLHRDDLPAAVATRASIFKLPESLCSNKPEAYLPRRVALGPYHHFRPELNKMELFKLENAKIFEDHFQLPEFDQLMDQLTDLEDRIRACFDRRLEMECMILAWTMVFDSMFLLGLLAFSSDDKQERYLKSQRLKLPLAMFDSQQFSLQFKPTLRVQYEVVSDTLMLENQIPFPVLKGILPSNMSDRFSLLPYRFCRSIFPFELPYDVEFLYLGRVYSLTEIIEQSHHLLHFLYMLVLTIPKERREPGRFSIMTISRVSVGFLGMCLNVLASVLNIPVIQQLNEAMGFIQSLFDLLRTAIKPSPAPAEPPVIPSASELQKVNISFKPLAVGSLRSAAFNKNLVTLHLPTITLDAFSEVLLRNLVAFEASAEMNTPCLTQYITLMSGLLATAKDVKILREEEIICSHLNSDEDVVKLFDGIRNSTDSWNEAIVLEIHRSGELNGQDVHEDESQELLSRTSRKRTMDDSFNETFKEINQYYESNWKVKTKKFICKYVHPILKIIFFLVTVSLGVLLLTRVVCSFFHCPKIFRPL